MLLRLLKFLIPISLWLYLFRDLLAGAVPLQSEPFGVYAMVKFYLDHLRVGIFPLWQPFLLWGFPWQIILNYFGFANPVWLLTLLLSVLGVKIYFAFLYTVVIYFLIGQVGFYFLAKAILQDKRAAYIAFLLFLFSSVGLVCMAQFNMLLIFVPSVWFFYFLINLSRRWDTFSWVGMIFSLMIIAQAYLPFYFLTVFLVAGLLFVLINFNLAKSVFSGLITFCRKRALLVILSCVTLICAMIPSYIAYKSTTTHEVVTPWRQKGAAVFTQGSTFSVYRKTTEGGLGSRISIHDIFEDPGRLIFSNDGFFFVSAFAFLILLLGAFNRINKKNLYFSILFAVLLAISLGNSTPIHQFLFEHVFYFKLMRNMHFYLPFLLCIFILLTAEQARLLLQGIENLVPQKRRGTFLAILFVHVGFWVFLHQLLEMSWATQITIVLSFIYCIVMLFPKTNVISFVQTLLLLACLGIHPFQVISGHNGLASERIPVAIEMGMAAAPHTTTFSFQRQDRHDVPPKVSTAKEQVDQYYFDYLSETDAQPLSFAWEQGAPAYWTYFAFKNLPEEVIEQYAKNKLVVYDSVALLSDDAHDLTGVANALGDHANVAFISNDRKELQSDLKGLIKGRSPFLNANAEKIEASSPMLRLRYFDANSIKLSTDYAQEKFLVYNDSFIRGWEAWCNGVKVPIYRANVAFKGLRLPAGHNEISFVYRPTGRMVFMILLIVLYWGVFLYLGIAAVGLVLKKNERK